MTGIEPVQKLIHLMAVAILTAGSALAQPKCEPFEGKAELEGDRVSIAVVLQPDGLPIRKVGIPHYVVEIHVAPDVISADRVPMKNEVKGVQKCMYNESGKIHTVSHVRLAAPLTLPHGPWKGYLFSIIELPRKAVADKVIVRTQIGDIRYIGTWTIDGEGKTGVVLKKQ